MAFERHHQFLIGSYLSIKFSPQNGEKVSHTMATNLNEWPNYLIVIRLDSGLKTLQAISPLENDLYLSYFR
jgi:hypothetical protein